MIIGTVWHWYSFESAWRELNLKIKNLMKNILWAVKGLTHRPPDVFLFLSPAHSRASFLREKIEEILSRWSKWTTFLQIFSNFASSFWEDSCRNSRLLNSESRWVKAQFLYLPRRIVHFSSVVWSVRCKPPGWWGNCSYSGWKRVRLFLVTMDNLTLLPSVWASVGFPEKNNILN